MKKKRRTVTLLEVLIALSLTVGVMSAMMWCYRTISELGAKADQERQAAFRQRYVQARLAYVLPLADSELFYQSQEGLVFQFNNDSDLDKDLGNVVIGRLYLDKNSSFCLALMPEKKRWQGIPPIKQEVLLENVEELAFRFFTKDAGWQENCTRLPAILEVNLKVDGKMRNYRYVLPNAEEEVVL